MKPSKIIGKPWIEPNGKRGTWVFNTEKGILTFPEIAERLGRRPASMYERFRRHGVKGLAIYGMSFENVYTSLKEF